jgi:CubicO group peptidase (beta-lactamase class C family)
MDAPVTGSCDARFTQVKEEFAHNFAERGEVGAALHVIIDGATVVDLSGGWRDEDRRQHWQPDTLVDFYSVGKAFLALLALQLVDGGLVGLDDALATVWPEFAAGGKEGATLRHALCHRAAVPAIREPLTNEDLWDWKRMTGALAATEPWWEPGTRHAYHTNTYGHLIGEVVRRVSGEACGRRLAAVAGPLGADVHVGVPPTERHRCAQVIFAAPGRAEGLDFEALEGDELMEMLSYFNPPGYSSMGVVNSVRWRQAEVPVDQRARHGARGGAHVRRAARARTPALRRSAGRGSLSAVPGLLPDPPRGCHLRARLQADGSPACVRAQPRELRSLRHGWCCRFRRSPRWCRVRLCHESCDPPLAEHAEPLPDRRGVRLALTLNGHSPG